MLYLYRDQIECPMIKELFTQTDKINELKSIAHKLSVLNDDLKNNIIKKYPLLENMYPRDSHLHENFTFEFVYYINSKHLGTMSRD